MAIKKYTSLQEYNAASKSSQESTVSHIDEGNLIKYDGVNVVTSEPQVGDALYLDLDKNKVFIVGDTLNKNLIPAGWVHVGEVFKREGDTVGILNKTGADRKYADVLQYSITAITQTSIVVKLKIQDTSKSGDAQYATLIDVPVTLTSAEINATSAAEISAAVAAKAVEKGDTAAWWAYLADANDNPVESDGTKIIVQCDVWKHWNQTGCSMTGGTITFTTWGDMPASNVYFKQTAGGAVSTENGGALNMARRIAYINSSQNTAAAPSANVGLGAGMVRRTEFNDSQYCQLLRDTYGTYEKYVEGDQMVMWPQKYGNFNMADGKTLTMKYALKSAPTKAGGTKYKFPAMYYAYATTYGISGLDYGDWFLPGVIEAVAIMKDANLAKIAATQTRAGGTTGLNNSTSRWFSQRYYASNARNFSGTNGNLSNGNVYNSFRSQAVALFKI